MAAETPQISSDEVRTRAFTAYAKIDACIPAIVRAVEGMGAGEVAKETYLVQLALESALSDLRGL